MTVLASEIQTTPITPLVFPGLNQQLYVKREDLCHSVISGNKWHKLRLNLESAKAQKRDHLVSFGGAWSNHLHALAYAASREGMQLHAYIRGDELAHKTLNPMLADIQNMGAKLYFLSRSEYREKGSKVFLEAIKYKHPNALVIPEGGANAAGVEGVSLFAEELLAQFKQMHGKYPSHIALSAGTGTFAAGFLKNLSAHSLPVKLMVYPALRDELNLKREFTKMVSETSFTIRPDYSFGGFAKTNATLEAFQQAFENDFGFALDPVYTNKLFYGVQEDCKQGVYPDNATVLLIHSGGLQGRRSSLSA